MPYLPAELIEPILPNLPVKSLLRYSAASKLWNSIISQPEFAQSYRGREMIVFFKSLRLNDESGFSHRLTVCPLSSLSSDNPCDKTAPYDFPFDFRPGSFLASCGNLWLVKFENSLLLYNPSIRKYRRLPDPKMKTGRIYGLGYDFDSDDYKILKIYLKLNQCAEIMTNIYSQRSDCWRKHESSQPPQIDYFLSRGLFVSGALHWLVSQRNTEKISILSFDLAEEKFGRIELPELLQKKSFGSEFWDMFLFGGKLRVCLNCVSRKHGRCSFSVWVLEDYEFKLWTKEMEFDYSHMPKLCYCSLKPFYFYDDIGKLVRAVTCLNEVEKMFVYKEDGISSTPTLVEKNFGSDGFGMIDSFTYVESFVSPPTLPRTPAIRKMWEGARKMWEGVVIQLGRVELVVDIYMCAFLLNIVIIIALICYIVIHLE